MSASGVDGWGGAEQDIEAALERSRQGGGCVLIELEGDVLRILEFPVDSDVGRGYLQAEWGVSPGVE